MRPHKHVDGRVGWDGRPVRDQRHRWPWPLGCIGGGTHRAVLLTQNEPIPQMCHEPVGCIQAAKASLELREHFGSLVVWGAPTRDLVSASGGSSCNCNSRLKRPEYVKRSQILAISACMAWMVAGGSLGES